MQGRARGVRAARAQRSGLKRLKKGLGSMMAADWGMSCSDCGSWRMACLKSL